MGSHYPSLDGGLHQTEHRHDHRRQRSEHWHWVLEESFLMISTHDAFKKFRSRLELNDREQQDASRRQKEIRELMDRSFDVEQDFLTGSYARWTKSKPLKDVDIFCVLGEKEWHYRNSHPSVLLT